MTPDEWRIAIETEAATPLPFVEAHTFVEKWESYSKPVAVWCYDGLQYVIKGRHTLHGRGPMERVCTNEQVVARIGLAMQGPLSNVTLVNVSQEFIDKTPQMSHIPAGLCHGCVRIKNCSDRSSFIEVGLPENRERYALIAALYGLCHAGDHQFFFPDHPPRIVYTFDHGHFFPGGPSWTLASLKTGNPPGIDPVVQAGANLTAAELTVAVDQMKRLVTDAVIAKAVASPPDLWDMDIAQRVELATYIATRRDNM